MTEVSCEQSRSQLNMYIWNAADAAAAILCIAVLLLLQQQQFCSFYAAVSHRVSDGKLYFWSLNLIPVFSLSSFKRDLF